MVIPYTTVRRYPGFPSTTDQTHLNPAQLMPGWYPVIKVSNALGGTVFLQFWNIRNVIITPTLPKQYLTDGQTLAMYFGDGMPCKIQFTARVPAEPITMTASERPHHPQDILQNILVSEGAHLIFHNVGYISWFMTNYNYNSDNDYSPPWSGDGETVEFDLYGLYVRHQFGAGFDEEFYNLGGQYYSGVFGLPEYPTKLGSCSIDIGRFSSGGAQNWYDIPVTIDGVWK